MRYRTIFFDLDGTLIDHFQALHRSHCYAMRQVGLPEPTYAQVHAAIGGGLELAITRLAGADQLKEVYPHFIKYWDATNLDDVVALPGAHEILTQLNAAGVCCAVLTNKRGVAAREVCAHLKLTPLLAGVFGADDVAWIKPDPRFAEYALTTLGRDAAGTALIGDSPWDVATAKNSGFAFYGVTTGTHNTEELVAAGASAENVFAGLPDVARALK